MLRLLNKLQKKMRRPIHWNSLEYKYTPLIGARIRWRPHNRTFWKEHLYMRAPVLVVPNQSMLRGRTLADQSDRASDLIYSLLSCAWTHLDGFLRRTSPAGSVSFVFDCPQFTLTPPSWSLLIHSISRAKAYFFLRLSTAYFREDLRILQKISVPRFRV